MSPEQEAEERGLDRALPAKATLLHFWKRDALQLTSPFQKRGGLGAALRENFAGTLARRLGLGSREDATLRWLELAGLTPSSARRRPGVGNPHLQGAEPAGSASPCR